MERLVNNIDDVLDVFIQFCSLTTVNRFLANQVVDKAYNLIDELTTEDLYSVGIIGAKELDVTEIDYDLNDYHKIFHQSSSIFESYNCLNNPNDIYFNSNINQSTYNRYIFGRENIPNIINEFDICNNKVKYVFVNSLKHIARIILDHSLCLYIYTVFRILDIVIVSNIIFIIFFLTFRHAVF
ncbi:MAG: hypothetical protein HFJ98_06715 [Eubacterium sp.]|nr:hypothetical protein [Eubacterium sp.]